MIWEKEFLKLVKAEFQKKKSRNPRFSIRQYAKKLELSIGALSELLAGKRRLTKARALKIVECLELTDEEKSRLFVLMGETQGTPQASLTSPEEIQGLQDLIKDWRNFVIMSVLFHPDDAQSIARVAKATCLSEDEVQARLSTMREKLPSETHVINFLIDPLQQTSQIFAGESLNQFRESQLQMMQKKMTQADQHADAFFYNLPLYTTQERYLKISQEIRQTLLKYLTVEPEEHSERLFQISMQILPLNSPKTT
jgi:hypothetical protein